MTLFQAGEFVLRGGRNSGYKIECDALTAEDWRGVAALVMEEGLLPPFREALGVPTGGVPFADAMSRHATGEPGDPVLICEDVVTTGRSMDRYRNVVASHKDGGVIGICLFARSPCPDWVTPVFRMATKADGGGVR